MDKILIKKDARHLIRPAKYNTFYQSRGWELIAIGTANTIYEIALACIYK